MKDEMYLDDYYGLNDSAYNQQRTCDEISQFVQDAFEDGESDEDILDFLNEEFDEETVSEGLQQLNQDLQDALFQHRGAPSKPKRSDFATDKAYSKACKEYSKKLNNYNKSHKHDEYSKTSMKKAENHADKALKASKDGDISGKLKQKYHNFMAGRHLKKSRNQSVRSAKYDSKYNNSSRKETKQAKRKAGQNWDKKVGKQTASAITKKNNSIKTGAGIGAAGGAGLNALAHTGKMVTNGATVAYHGFKLPYLAAGGAAGAAVGAGVGAGVAAYKHYKNRSKAGKAFAESRKKKLSSSKKK